MPARVSHEVSANTAPPGCSAACYGGATGSAKAGIGAIRDDLEF